MPARIHARTMLLSPLLVAILTIGCQQPAADTPDASATTGAATAPAVAADSAAQQAATAEAPATGGEIEADALLERMAAGDAMLILDVRTPEEYAEGHVPGAVNISHTDLADHLDEVRAAGDVDIVVYCRSGRRAGIAREALAAAGFGRLLQLRGDMLQWQERGLPIETPGDSR